ncbi:MAG: GumC family protein [Terriglobales bacterium]
MAEDLVLIPATARNASPSLRDVVAIFFRQRQLWLVSFALIFVVILLWGIFLPSYQAEMKILVRKGRLDPVLTPTPTQSPLIEDETVTEEELNSEVELMQDQDTLRAVVKDSGLLSGWRMPWNLGGSEEVRLARATRRLGKKLDVEAVKKSALITVTYDSSNPDRAASVLRSLAAAYLAKHQQIRRPSGQFNFFDQQMIEARSGLQQAASQLMEFTQLQGVVSAPLERDIALKQLSDADASFRETSVALAETRQRVRSLEASLRILPERATTVIRNSDNPMLLGQLKVKLLELGLKRTDLLSKFQPSYRVVEEVDKEIAETKLAIAAEDQSPVRDVTTQPDPNNQWSRAELVKNRVEVQALEARARASGAVLADYKASAHRLGDQAIEQEQLVRTLQAAEDKYLLYVNKREEARIGDALDQGGILNVAVAQKARVPALPIWSLWMFGFVALLTSGTVSTWLAFTADYFSPAFRTPEEVIAYLGSPVLASLPGDPSVG